MPQQKDLKRAVRARMQKTGEAYTAARLQLLRSKAPEPDYAALAGMSDETVKSKTGRDWREWVKLLDAAECATRPHGEIARHVASLGVPGWWSQSVTVGYERIRGLRAIGQRRSGHYEANKSRTFPVPVEKLYRAFSVARTRAKWLPAKFEVRGSTPNKRMRIRMEDETIVEIGFTPKGEEKSVLAVQHSKLPDKATADRMKAWWAERFDALSELLP